MKSLKFTPELSAQICAGTKNTTWRVFDDKDLSTGDELVFIHKETREAFGRGVIEELSVKKLAALTPDELREHGYKDCGEMYTAFTTFYGDKISPQTEVKIITFSFKPNEWRSTQTGSM